MARKLGSTTVPARIFWAAASVAMLTRAAPAQEGLALPAAHSTAVPFTVFGTGQTIRGSISPEQRDAVAGTITLNFVGVPVAQAAKTVLGDIMGVTYVVDPRVNGAVTLQTSRPISKSAALDLFQTALLPVGGTVVRADGLFRVVPADQAATGSVTTGSRAVPELDGTSYRVVALRYVAASEMVRVLDPIVPKGMIVEADDARNILALRGSATSLRNVLDTIRDFDIDVLQGMSFGIVPVQSRDPDRMAEDLRSIFSSDKEGPLKGRVRFIANARLAAIIVVASQPGYLALARQWIGRLDAQRRGSEPELHVYVVQNRPARELAKVLQAMFGEEAGDGGLSGTLTAPRSGAASSLGATSAGANGSAMPGAAGLSPNGSPASGGEGLANPFGSPSAFGTSGNGTAGPNGAGGAGSSGGLGGSAFAGARGGAETAGPTTAVDQPRLRIVADDVKNSLVVMADAADYRRILKVVKSMDVAASQVMIQAAVAEVSLTDQLQYGVQWQLQNNGATAAASTLATTASATSTTVATAATAAAPGFNYMLKLGSVASTLNALNAITRVNVISTPSLMVMDNKTAALQIGDQVPITTQTSTSTITANSAIVNSVEMRDTGVILSVTPRINESGHIQLDIEQEVSSVVKTTSSGIDSPTIQQRRVKTTVVVNDGEVLALGGMIQNRVEKDSSEIPFLGSLPLVGAAFGSRGHNVSKTELIILISPRIVRNVAEARQVTADARREVHVYQPPEPSQGGLANTARRLVQQP